MANTLLTPSIIAREALANLYAQTVMLPLVHRDYSAEFAQIGDTLTIRKPATFTAQDFGTAGSISIQNATESSTSVVMNKHYDVSFEVTSKEMSLSVDDFSAQFIAPAMEAHAQNIDQLLLGLYADVYESYGTAGTTPGTVADITGARQVLNSHNVPMMDRRFVVGPAADAKILQQEAFTNLQWNPVANADALNEAAIGRKFGFDFYTGNNVATHSNGTIASTGTFAINGAVAAGATTLIADGTTVTGTWKAGSLFTIAGQTQQYVVTADATAAANAVTISFLPAAPTGGFADNSAITRVAGHVANLAFHRNAFAFVSRPLAMPMGGVQAEVVDYQGLGLRAVYDYNSTTKKNIVSLDILFGVKTLDPMRAVRVLG